MEDAVVARDSPVVPGTQLELRLGQSLGVEPNDKNAATPELGDDVVGTDVLLVGDEQDGGASPAHLVLADLAVGLLRGRRTPGVDDRDVGLLEVGHPSCVVIGGAVDRGKGAALRRGEVNKPGPAVLSSVIAFILSDW
jgi:hypothetical protein